MTDTSIPARDRQWAERKGGPADAPGLFLLLGGASGADRERGPILRADAADVARRANRTSRDETLERFSFALAQGNRSRVLY